MITVGPGIRICILVWNTCTIMYILRVLCMCTLFVYYLHHLGRYVPGSVYIGVWVALLLAHREIVDDNR
jgi:hypothetical protein